jgi:prolipoprotein diacylglyceryltransferase
LALISLERIVVEVFRINPEVLSGLSEAQVIGMLLMLLGGLFIFAPRRSARTT